MKIDDYDAWNLNHTLALIIHPSLVTLKEITRGCPADLTLKKWEVILDKMIFAFESLAADNWSNQYYSGTIDYKSIPIDKAGKGVTEDAPDQVAYRIVKDTFKIDRRGLNKHAKQIQDGLELFGKYYQSLWD